MLRKAIHKIINKPFLSILKFHKLPIISMVGTPSWVPLRPIIFMPLSGISKSCGPSPLQTVLKWMKKISANLRIIYFKMNESLIT
jgi:hypothetical protein